MQIARKTAHLLICSTFVLLSISACGTTRISLPEDEDQTISASTSPFLIVDHSSLSIECPAGSTESLTISPMLIVTSDQPEISFDVSLEESLPWLSVAPSSGSTPLTSNAHVDCAQLADGDSITGTINLLAQAPGTGTLSVSMSIAKLANRPPPPPPPPGPVVQPRLLSFECAAGSTQTISVTPVISLSSDQLGNEFDVALSESDAWLSLSTQMGTTPFTATAQVDCGQLSNGAAVNGSIDIQAQAPGVGSVTVSISGDKLNPTDPNARTLYVAQQNPNCDDQFTRSQNSLTQPWCTIARANNQHQSGDTVRIKPGEYREPLLPKDGQNTFQHTVYSGLGNVDEILILGSEVVTGWQLHSGNIYKASFAAPDQCRNIYENNAWHWIDSFKSGWWVCC